MKVAILTDANMYEHCERIAHEIQTSSVLELVGIVGVGAPPGFKGRLHQFRARLKRFGWGGAAREVIHRRIHPPPPSPTSSETVDAQAYCQEHGIPYAQQLRANDEKTTAALVAMGASIVVTSGAGILRAVLLDTPGLTFVNAHAGKLPHFGGMHVCEWAVYHDHPIHGTIHRMDLGIDTGAILWEAPLDVAHARTVDELRAAAFREVWSLVPVALEALARGEADFRAQPKGEPVKQRFRMHPRLKEVIADKLAQGTFAEIQRASMP